MFLQDANTKLYSNANTNAPTFNKQEIQENTIFQKCKYKFTIEFKYKYINLINNCNEMEKLV